MAKLKLNPDPTFQAKVGIPVPGGNADIVVTLKYRDRDELASWTTANETTGELEVMADVVLGWDLEDEFGADNLKRLCDKYPGASRAIVTAYVRELAGIRQGN